MKEIIFATNNEHKLSEARAILANRFKVLSLNDIGFEGDIPETATTLNGNAVMKAQYIYDRYHTDVFADDTGLEVDALGGAPGVYSARYAGEAHDSEANMRKLLSELGDSSNRNAQFTTVIALIEKPDGTDGTPSLKCFTGAVKGQITREKYGRGGFGYDPIFRPDGYTMTFADLSPATKNDISHRGRALRKMAQYLLNK